MKWYSAALGLRAVLVEELGIEPDDRVLLMCDRDSWFEYAVAYVAILAAGAVVVNGHGEDELEQVQQIRRMMSPRMMLVAGSKSVLLARGIGSFYEVDVDILAVLPVVERDTRRRSAGSVVEVLFTSGTTGPPKAVGCTRAGIEFALRQDVPAPSDDFPEQSVLVHHIMPGTQAAQRVLFQAMRTSRLVSIGVGSLRSAEFVSAVVEHGARFIGLVPLTARGLVRQCQGDDLVLRSVRWVSVGSAHVPQRLLADVARVCPSAAVMNMYGTTEAGVARILSRYPAQGGALGRPEAGTVVEIRDSRGRPVSRGVRGELWIRSPGCPTRCYVDDPALTDRTFRDGWTRTADLAIEDHEGLVYLAGRESEMILVAGREVSPDDVEDCLLDHELVDDVAVYGVPAEGVGAEIVAAVIPASAEVSSALLERVLRSHCEEHLPADHLPTTILRVAALPVGQFATVQKRQLRASHPVPTAGGSDVWGGCNGQT